MNQEKRHKVLGMLESFQLFLERYPKLLAFDYIGGGNSTITSISSLMEILNILGVSNEFIYKWLANLLLDEEGSSVKKGVLVVIEESVKSILLGYLNSLYTCPIDPILPDYFLNSPYNASLSDSSSIECPKPFGRGIGIPLSKIDAFGLLQNCPTSENGSVFYFDNGYSTSTIYRTTDMNAFLWYIINKGNGDERSIWDNRVLYRAKFNDSEDGEIKKQRFVDEKCPCSPSKVVRGVGVKNEIFYAKFEEMAFGEGYTDLTINDLKEINYIRIYGISDRYFRQGLSLNGTSIESGRTNKTIRQFNTDYISSLKLFDSKTLTASVINAMLGISSVFSGKFSYQTNVAVRKIEKIIERIVTMEGVNPEDENNPDSFFEFSESQYNEIENDATLRYNRKYSTGNETGALESIDIDGISGSIRGISGRTPEEKENSIISAITSISENLSSSESIDKYSKDVFENNIAYRFLKEIMIQVAMQVLSPKIMLLFAINEKFLENTQDNINDLYHWEMFFKNFWNIMKSCVSQIGNIIIQAMLDLVIGQIRPIVRLISKKLMLEYIYYHKKLIRELLLAGSTVKLQSFGENMTIDNVNYADIIPVQTTPDNG